jgi:hypothetical protein
MEDEVSSMEAACSEAPSARDWLAEDTCPDADATCSAPSLRPEMIRVRKKIKCTSSGQFG